MLVMINYMRIVNFRPRKTALIMLKMQDNENDEKMAIHT